MTNKIFFVEPIERLREWSAMRIIRATRTCSLIQHYEYMKRSRGNRRTRFSYIYLFHCIHSRSFESQVSWSYNTSIGTVRDRGRSPLNYFVYICARAHLFSFCILFPLVFRAPSSLRNSKPPLRFSPKFSYRIHSCTPYVRRGAILGAENFSKVNNFGAREQKWKFSRFFPFLAQIPTLFRSIFVPHTINVFSQ